MVFDVLLRDGSTGNCRVGHALTGSDAPWGSTAVVMGDTGIVTPVDDVVVCLRPPVTTDECMDLLHAGFPVQIRTID